MTPRLCHPPFYSHSPLSSLVLHSTPLFCHPSFCNAKRQGISNTFTNPPLTLSQYQREQPILTTNHHSPTRQHHKNLKILLPIFRKQIINKFSSNLTWLPSKLVSLLLLQPKLPLTMNYCSSNFFLLSSLIYIS